MKAVIPQAVDLFYEKESDEAEGIEESNDEAALEVEHEEVHVLIDENDVPVLIDLADEISEKDIVLIG